MTDGELFIDGIRYVPTRTAARSVGLTQNYISKMCKAGVPGTKLVYGIWYVNEEALKSFLAAQNEEREKWVEQLSERRKREFLRVRISRSSPGRFTTLPPRALHEHHARKRQGQSARTALVASIAGIVFMASSGLTFEMIAPPGSAARAHLSEMFSAVHGQLAAAGSLPIIDSFADALYRTMCPFFRSCIVVKKTQTLAQAIPSTTVTTYASPITPATATSSPGAARIVQNIVQPVIERVIYREPASADIQMLAGSSLSQIDLDALETRLNSRITSISLPVSFPQSVAAGGIAIPYNAPSPAAERIDKLSGVSITNPSISGGSISGTTISTDAITLSSALSAASAAISGALTSLSATITNLAATTIVATNATTTNSTSTNQYASSLVATNATSTNFSATNASTTNLIVSSAGGSAGCATFSATGILSNTGVACGSGGGSSFGESWAYAGGTSGFLTPTSTTARVNILQASSTLFSANFAKIGGSASTTIDSSGNVAVGGTLDVTGKTTLGNASTTNVSATYASSTNLFAGSATVGALSGFVKATAGLLATALVNLASDITGILPVANGGTGWASLASGAIPYGNGTGVVATTSAGTPGQVLALSNGIPSWVSTTTLSTISGTLDVSKGGTGASTFSYGLLLSPGGTTAVTNIATSSLGLLTTDVAEGTNEYWTNVRFDTRLSATTSLPNITTLANLSLPATQLTSFGVPFFNFFSATTTSALAEGTNKYYTDARVGSYISGSSTVPHIGGTAFGDLLTWTGSAWTTRATSTLALNTDNLVEGSSNLFWTNTRFDNRLAATTTLPNITTLANLASIGSLTSGSIGSGFGAINIGGNALTAGNASLAAATTTALSVVGPSSFTNSANFFGVTSFGATGTTTIATNGTISTPSVIATSATSTFHFAGTLSANSATIGGTASSTFSSNGSLTVGNALSVTGLSSFTQASSTRLSIFDRLYVGDTATTTILGSATSTFGAGIQTSALNITSSTATSTFANGISLSGGCVLVNGSCLGSGSGSVGSGSQGQFAFYNVAGTALAATSTLTLLQSGLLGIGTTTPNAKLTVYGDIFAEGSNRYLNFGTTQGTNGYGFRDNSGTLEFKNSGGSWQGVTTATSGPSFLVTKGGSNQTVTADTVTKITWSTESFDTNNNFDSTTNHRFTPTVPGKYILTAALSCLPNSAASGYCEVYIYKNGSMATFNRANATTNNGSVAVTTVILDMNGSTDYFEAWGTSNSTTFDGTATRTYFTGALIAPVNATAGGWQNDNTQSFLADSTDLVGIGTSTPWAKLAINPLAGDANQFVVGSSTRTSFLINPTGNVGIGTTTPGSNLSVVSGLSIGANYGVAAPTGGAIIQGNVGIGTTSPRAKLDVTDGTSNVDGTTGALNLTDANIALTDSNGNLNINTSDAQAIDMGGGIALGGLYRASLRDNVAFAVIKSGKTNSTDSNYSGYLAFGTRLSGGGVLERMRINESGNVGIGTAGPGQKLTIEGTAPIAEIRSGGYLMLRPTANDWDMRIQAVSQRLDFLSGGDLVNPRMTIQQSGNVGIGTTSPSKLFTVDGGGLSAGTQVSYIEGLYAGSGNVILMEWAR
ncbi:hypothetical protein HY968_00025, partial [Candidatus Kaiserbacteria bacterium]|nr:hypothetical protein [Candidatus Kaiserbacteria bacterium]